MKVMFHNSYTYAWLCFNVVVAHDIKDLGLSQCLWI